MKNISYFFKRKWWQIKNVFKWLPVIWNQYDFDYRYAIEVFRFQLLKISEFMEGPNSKTLDASQRAKRIRTLIKLMDKVYNEEYACEYQDQIEEKYGKYKYEFIPTHHNSNHYECIKCWDKQYTDEQIQQIETEETQLFNKSKEKQEKAHRIMWSLIEKDIRSWWD